MKYLLHSPAYEDGTDSEYLFHSPAYEDGTDSEFRNVGN